MSKKVGVLATSPAGGKLRIRPVLDSGVLGGASGGEDAALPLLCVRFCLAAASLIAIVSDPRMNDGVADVASFLAGGSYRPDDPARPTGYRAGFL